MKNADLSTLPKVLFFKITYGKIYKREIETMNEDVNLQIKYEEEDQKIPSSKSLAKK
jgi:hypothetical protein